MTTPQPRDSAPTHPVGATTAPQIIAHRGNKSVAPENTLAAFVSAIKAGAHSIEMDIVPSKDGVPMVIHDTTLDATTTGTGHVTDYTAADIAQLDAGSWFDPAYTGQRVPTFDQFAALIARHPGVEVLLEFKGDWDTTACAPVLETIDTHGISDRTIVQSFNRTTIESLHTLAPTRRRGVLTVTDIDGLIAQCQAANIWTINPHVDHVLANPSLIERIHNAGMRTMIWTANTPNQWATLVELGVDAIITDRPDALAGWYEAHGLTHQTSTNTAPDA